MLRLTGRVIGVSLICLSLGPTRLPACSVPVFRYALERWSADDYEVIIAHRGQLDAEAQASIDQIASDQHANVTLQTEDLNDTQDSQLVARWEEVGAETAAWMFIRYPESTRLADEAWSAPLTRGNVQQLVDSSARRQIAERLLAGDTAVFVFLEIGDAARDDPAFERLQSELVRQQQQIRLPEIDQADIDQGLLTVDPEDLKIAFTTLRLSRDDTSEVALVASLLGTEYDLRQLDAPMVFVVFGRGRVLYALVGSGINAETIAQACADITGPCTCTVKQQNPGVDLLMAVDWDEHAQRGIRQQHPDLAGLGQFTSAPEEVAGQDVADPDVADPDVADPDVVDPGASDATGGTVASPSGGLTRTLVLMAIITCITVAGITLWITRRVNGA